ncbi:MAG: hypothetical protein KC656_28980, partial [Myxococcales bacterium]|nr:hypothetical protein [Myxococcales bacterium]
MNHHALIATARYHGEVVQERLEPGPPVSIGNGPPLALPLPEGVAHLAHVEWGRGGRPRIVDAMGRQYLLEPEEALEMELGDIHVELELTPQFTLRRTDAVSWRLSIGWLVVVLLFTISTSWYDTIKQHRCEIFGFSPELSIVLGCVQAQADNGGAGELTAEYLARLLKEDYAGEEDGYLQREERPNEGRERQDIFLPSGNRGPIEKMGGGEEAGPEVLKAQRTEELAQAEKKEAG